MITVQRVKTTLILVTLACTCALLPAARGQGLVVTRPSKVEPIHKLSKAELEARLEGDSRAMQVQRQGLRSVISYMESRSELFPATGPRTSRLLRREEKEIAWNTWQRFLDYIVALDSIEQYHARFYRLKGAAKEDSFLIGYAAMLAKYRSAMEFIERAEHNAELDKVLNDPVPELGLPAGTYAKLKFKYLNVAIATDFAAREVLMKTFSGDGQPGFDRSEQWSVVRDGWPGTGGCCKVVCLIVAWVGMRGNRLGLDKQSSACESSGHPPREWPLPVL